MKRHDDILLFIDVDGVLAAHGGPFHGQLDPAIIKRLSNMIARHSGWRGNMKVVLNSAWNARGLGKIKDLFQEAGFEHPEKIVGVTDSNSGGGDPIRRYLQEHKLIGTRFIIIDDSSHDYDEMWCQLVWVDGQVGLTDLNVNQANQLAWRDPRATSEKKYRDNAIKHLIARCEALANAKWLSGDEKHRYMQEYLDLIRHCLLVPDFKVRAMIVPSPEPKKSRKKAS